MTIYSPEGGNTAAAVVVFRGGGHQILGSSLLQSRVMKRRDVLQSLPAAALLPVASWLSSLDNSQDKVSSGRTASMVYELRVYHTYEGKLDDLLRRFREHTMRLFEKHGIRNVAYWTPIDEPLKGRTLFYVLAHSSREAATANWDAFRNDPDWQAARDKSEANGKLVEKVESTFLSLTDFSPPLR
jgi:NIPSNAP